MPGQMLFDEKDDRKNDGTGTFSNGNNDEARTFFSWKNEGANTFFEAEKIRMPIICSRKFRGTFVSVCVSPTV